MDLSQATDSQSTFLSKSECPVSIHGVSWTTRIQHGFRPLGLLDVYVEGCFITGLTSFAILPQLWLPIHALPAFLRYSLDILRLLKTLGWIYV